MQTLKDVQALFPSENGNAETRNKMNQLLSQILYEMDNLKDPNKSTLGEPIHKGEDFYRQITNQAKIPMEGQSYEQLLNELVHLMKGHPYHTNRFLTNVLPMASIPGLIGQFTASLLNGNNLWDVYGPAGAQAETEVISIMSQLAGYDHQQSWGYTTWGGQGAVFTSLRIAISKHAPFAMEVGVPQNLYCFSSEQAHYSLIKSAEATGLGRSHVIKVKTKDDHSLDEQDLAKKMNDVIKNGGIPIYVVATTGTTDNFAIDNIKTIKQTVDTITSEHELSPVHLHADSALGGFYCVFNHYDFENNPLQFEKTVLEGLLKIKERMQYLSMADSLCFDFQKLGQTPYVTSLFLVKQQNDLKLIDLEAEESPYVGDRGYGHYHTSYTLECSRMASSISILAALKMFGVEGYQQLLANYVRVNLVFRQKLSETFSNIHVTNKKNIGPVTAFRLYLNGTNWAQEQNGELTKEQILATNKINEELFEYFGEKRSEIFLGDTKKFDLVPVSNGEKLYPIYVSKLFSISPYTETKHLDEVIQFIQKAVETVAIAEAQPC
ncbi:pyridoxal phosphate-dependent decarboxylase family protein [Alkalihalobacillus sp. 1P02AB]|uniref:pyridoxal phosphate-dependent decarboxylase family protein n=1 Tax=Alkalihalobacillus sp. 1P02AB TaxID=3132260 RepID=UPI0039A75E2D